MLVLPHKKSVMYVLTIISPKRPNASRRSLQVVVFSIFPTKSVLVHAGSKSSSGANPKPDVRGRLGASLLWKRSSET